MSDPTHQLALPLPLAYQGDSDRGYSFFSRSSRDGPPGVHGEALERYLDDLCAFLRKTKLIQRHPDNFFSYIRGEDWRATASHPDHAEVSCEELSYTLRLCHAFQDVLREEGNTGDLGAFTSGNEEPRGHGSDGTRPPDDLRGLLRHGPPRVNRKGESSSNSAEMADLHEFYQTTRRLMLNRQKSDRNDAASATLTMRGSREPSAQPLAEQVPDRARGEEQRQRALKVVLSFGMSLKKQHEVAIMRGTIADLVDCCRDATASPETVINIGEGKGYVSRAIALCDGLQVVGVDCNPAHKEKAVERAATLLNASVSVRDGEQGKDMVNLFYQDRGHVASVVCRLGDTVDWASLLRGHVRTVDERSGAVTAIDTDKTDDNGCTMPDDSCDVMDSLGPVSLEESDAPSLHSYAAKVKCKVCGHLIRLSAQRAMLKHAHAHLASNHDEGLPRPASMPTRAEVQRWNLTLSQERYAARLASAFFVSLPPPPPAQDAAEAPARHHSREVVVDGGDTRAAKRHKPSADDGVVVPGAATRAHRLMSPLHLPRGARALVVHAGTAYPPGQADGARRTGGVAARGDRPHEETSRDGWTTLPATDGACLDEPASALEEVFVTVTGFDDASGSHVVLRDNSCKRETYALLMLQSPERPSTEAIHELLRPIKGQAKRAVVLRVLPFAKTATPLVSVPSLRNTIMMGLHPCGDLGSNVCRLFMRTECRGLMLVSCCWHALTREGFPLSAAMTRRGLTVESISLLLATQPLDMWASASAEGHRSSAKILFFRSLLGLLWTRLASAYASSEPTTCGKRCLFSPAPLLEPAFLRKINRVKEQLDFASFVSRVLETYIFTATSKSTAYTWHNLMCEACRGRQETFFRGAAAAALLQEVTETYCHALFSSFLGLTVLRMWMCHLVESALLLDRALYLHESMLVAGREQRATESSSAVSLAPLFDGAVSPRMYAILARRVSP